MTLRSCPAERHLVALRELVITGTSPSYKNSMMLPLNSWLVNVVRNSYLLERENKLRIEARSVSIVTII